MQKEMLLVLLIDQKYLIDKNFREYTEDLVKLVDDNTRIYPVQLRQKAYEMGCGLSSYQFIQAVHGDLSDERKILIFQ